MTRMGFEPTFSAGERPKTYALDRAATGTGTLVIKAVIDGRRSPREGYFFALFSPNSFFSAHFW